MGKFSSDEKYLAVQAYLTGKESYRGIAERIGIDHKSVMKWVALYQAHGIEGLVRGYTTYSKQFKMDVLNFIKESGTSHLETAAIYNIPAPSTITQWKKVLSEQGEDALNLKKKGRPSMKKENKSTPPEGSAEAIQAELDRLRMENAYLKKLNALVQSKEKLPSKSKRK
jgi:transposase